jgi:hypothetical protein
MTTRKLVAQYGNEIERPNPAQHGTIEIKIGPLTGPFVPKNYLGHAERFVLQNKILFLDPDLLLSLSQKKRSTSALKIWN